MDSRSTFFRMMFAVGLLTTASSAYAALVTDVWESTVFTATNHSVFAPGDTFTWTVTYDDAGLIMHEYGDGPNGMAEFGAGDDTLANTICTGAASGLPGCIVNYTTEYTLLSDAVFDLSQFYNPMQSAGLTGWNNTDLNYAKRMRQGNGVNNARFQADDLLFAVAGAQTAFWDSAIAASNSTYTTFSSVLLRTVDVPEPATIALFAIGLFGAGMLRRRKGMARELI